MGKFTTYDRDEFFAAIAAAVREGITFNASHTETMGGILYWIEYTGGY